MGEKNHALSDASIGVGGAVLIASSQLSDHPSLDNRPPMPRSCSNTAVSSKGRRRPLSRASTTSIHSQPILDQQLADPAEYQKQWYEQQANAHAHHQRYASMGHQMTAEDMVMHSASQLQNPRGYDLDPALSGVNHHHPLAYPQEPQYKHDHGRQSMPADVYGGSYGDGESQLMETRSDEQDEADAMVGGPAKKTSKSSAANELEMRQLFQANKHRSLPEIATELHGNERGPQSERQRQVFAMLWYAAIV